MAERVVVGMSGGVDSSVAALLLKEQGYEVVGVTMQVWDAACSLQMEREGGCCGQSAVEDARRVCDVIGIPYYVIGFRDIFQKKVIDYFVEEYLKGRTPNPCIACNRYVKWEALLQKAEEIGASYIATGHYARIERLPNGRFSVRNSVTAKKDQTYALYRLTQDELAHTLMPVGDYHKEEIRRIARENHLPVANKPDSEEICFVADDDYAGFVDRQAGERVPKPGRFIYRDGRDLGPNKGITHYTVGQRKHLGIAMGHPVFVTGLDPETGNVFIGENEDVFGRELTLRGINYMAVPDLPEGVQVRAEGKIRYGMKAASCTLEKIGADEIKAVFDAPVRAITPGQGAVFYEGDHILLGGSIEKKV
ncbi:MAG: tRNA 2-thiouridine(34) synthase MnmA [Lachnospiraceae bacterium]|nr:tRNA 2-thiouridine(34) synthase MnmA [Lachnospiraceae bacterium]